MQKFAISLALFSTIHAVQIHKAVEKSRRLFPIFSSFHQPEHGYNHIFPTKRTLSFKYCGNRYGQKRKYLYLCLKQDCYEYQR